MSVNIEFLQQASKQRSIERRMEENSKRVLILEYDGDVEKFNENIKSCILPVSDIESRIEFVDPVHNNAMDPHLRDPCRYREYEDLSMYYEYIDPNLKCSRELFARSTFGRSTFRFCNDNRNELNEMLGKYRNYDNALDFLEVYAIHNRSEHWVRRFPYFFDPISARVRVTKIIGSRYFLSDNGYVCNADDYLLENEEQRYRRKYILL